MSYKPKIWTQDKNEWLFKHGSESPAELYRLFKEAFPDVETTQTGVCNQRSRIGACTRHNTNISSRKARPLYSEQKKKGYIRIKVAQPNVWVMKHKWVYMETHPWEYNSITREDVFVFMDGDNRNFSPENIERLSRAELAVINSKNGFVKGQPELNRIILAQARLKIASLDVGEKLGMTRKYGTGRIFIEKTRAQGREYMRKKRLEKKLHLQ